MKMFVRAYASLVLAISFAAVTAGCSAASNASGAQGLVQPPASFNLQLQPALHTPSLVGVNLNNGGSLEFWPIQAHGGNRPQPLTNPIGFNYSGVAGNGHVIIGGNQSGVMLYNLDTKKSRTLPNPYGSVVDVAIDKQANIFAVSVGTHSGIVWYPHNMPHATRLTCNLIGFPEAIAADNEGDVFVNGYGPHYYAGVVEIPNGPNGPDPQHCVQLPLKTEPGYVAGVAIDPKTDDLIVLDNPSTCAGGVEGRMTIYPKPYSKTTGVSHNLNANCAGSMRLNADSTLVFVLDQDVSGSYTFILQRSYPDGRDMGSYNNGNTGGFTTIPNTLPN